METLYMENKEKSPNGDNKIGISIKMARKASKLTQTQLGNCIGTSHAAISFWENGVNVPNVLDCWKMADSMGISIDELVGRE
jgi:DNA-binding XRE family transcriptional regulator